MCSDAHGITLITFSKLMFHKKFTLKRQLMKDPIIYVLYIRFVVCF